VTGSTKVVTVSSTTFFTLTAPTVPAPRPRRRRRGGAESVVARRPRCHDDRTHVGRTVHDARDAPARRFAHDPNVYTQLSFPRLGGNASKAQFFVDDTMVLEVLGSNAEYWIFKGFVSGIAADATG
jgi:hypothetical protein